MMRFIKQNKGKDLKNVPESRKKVGPYYFSRKYDGHYTQIIYDSEANEVKFFTSGGKEYYLDNVAEYIKGNFLDSFHIECEYNYGCEGKLGDRGKSARLTTYRTAHAKCLVVEASDKDIFRVLDRLDMPNSNFRVRISTINVLFRNSRFFMVPEQIPVINIADGVERSKKARAEGYEGGMLKHADHLYQEGKRGNDIIKLKPRPTADLLCVGVTEGEGKYEGMIGSLVLRDSKNRDVNVGSGLDDFDRSRKPEYFIGKVIEIEYEQILDTYQQPVFKYIRLDKEPINID